VGQTLNFAGGPAVYLGRLFGPFYGFDLGVRDLLGMPIAEEAFTQNSLDSGLQIAFNPVPEASTGTLVGIGLVGLRAASRRRRAPGT
jgi:hypothetical protein